MRFLFVVDTLRDKCGANINIVMNLSDVFRRHGHCVIALLSTNSDNQICDKHAKRFDKVYHFENTYYDLLKEFKTKRSWDNKTVLDKAISYLSSPRIIPAWIDSRFLRGLHALKQQYIKEIERIDINENFDVIIAFSGPHWTEQIVSEVKNSGKKGIVQMDPFIHLEFMYGEGAKKRSSIQEKVINHVDRLFVTRQEYDEIISEIPGVDKSKLCVYQFPGIKTVEKSFEINVALSQEKKTIDVYYIGSLYESIRNPDFTLKLFFELPSDIRLHIVGHGAEEIIQSYKKEYGNRLVIHGSVSLDEAAILMHKADILLSINNNVRNLTPSKLFDYINTGKPIVNICKLDDCPSLEYIRKYPYRYIIFEKDGISDSLLVGLTGFIRNTAGIVAPREIILRNYWECTDEYMFELIMKNI